MKHLQTAIESTEAICRRGFSKPPTVLPHIHHAFASMTGGVDKAEEEMELIPFLQDCKKRDVSYLRRSDLNRVLRGAWCDEEFDELALSALARATRDPRSSSARALIDGYLLYFPEERPAIQRLANACKDLVQSQGNAWTSRAEVFKLFDPKSAVQELGRRMVQDENGSFARVCLEAGLGESPFATRLGQKAFSKACLDIALLKPEQATAPQGNLLDFLEAEDEVYDQAVVARALLEPWLQKTPPVQLRKRITGFLIDRVADPRLNPAKWESIKNRLGGECGAEHAEAIIDVLRRWLTEAAMRLFFRAIAKTTDRKDQWETREKFWLAYLDAGLVTDAWPALGPRAKYQISRVARSEGEHLEHGETTNCPQASSALIMRIGNLVIAEWSDNGRCRFWLDDAADAPKLYRRYYDNSVLRVMEGSSGFEALVHDAAGNWRYRFARVIYNHTGVKHPAYGRGL